MPADTSDTDAPLDNSPYLTIDEAAARLKVARTTLAKWRCQGRGPVYRHHGVIVYHVDDLDAWSREQRRTQTRGNCKTRSTATTPPPKKSQSEGA